MNQLAEKSKVKEEEQQERRQALKEQQEFFEAIERSGKKLIFNTKGERK